MEKDNRKQIVYTLAARCRDCYRCLRVCPVKAIRLHKGQAYVEEGKCIACGTCIRECPQKAKTFRNDVETVEHFFGAGCKVAASIAPSFAAVFNDWQRKRLASALRMLGFSYIGETSTGAWYVAKATVGKVAERKGKPSVCTACPAVVNYVEMYRPELVESLVPVTSPMVAHAKYLKEKLGEEWKVVFIGPCVAKKSEAERPENIGHIDAVLTFSELVEWFTRKNINLANCEASNFNEIPIGGDAKLFPLPGGLIKTGAIDNDGMRTEVFHASGITEIKDALQSVQGNDCFLEPLFCPEGCINGPGMGEAKNLFERRKEVIRYAQQKAQTKEAEPFNDGNLAAEYESRPVGRSREITEEEIKRVLENTGKSTVEQQLNCGACGYNSCREKAIAVIEGMAEPEMCLPYMRRLAEQRTDRVIDTSPNGIVMLDENLNILSMNPAFKKFFVCSDAVLGKSVSYLMDPEHFEQLASGSVNELDITERHDSYNMVCHELLYALREEKQYVGIFINVTKSYEEHKKLQNIKQQTVTQAQELLEHQINIAQKIAMFLGESTAHGEELVRKLMSLSGEDDEKKG